MGSGEYDCSPSDYSPDTRPPMCPEYMTRMLYGPTCLVEDDTSILEQLLKRMYDEPAVETLPVRRGLHFQEDVDISTINGVVFTILPGSLDCDGRRHSGRLRRKAYILVVASMLGIWMATRSRTSG